ncbi:hypothetical protein FisN_2Lh187 [Fistulifera solaris]|uniref:CN hydrolase domain-containing protein n=1 Tax=Fistulifera solaris TaxID=1519565 RepID=A0A1Z5KF43_FISSO|nr:hypothetical protein FisN_2Lh187 [Fistulifera solaris]|eukprot:GAX24913.1 hypothetical protein FisN_2Lh187 [Fistulifera solaris]
MSTIAVAQLCSTSSKLDNLLNIAKCAHQARQHNCVMLFLPECFGYMGISAEETLANAEPPIDLIATNAQALSQALVSMVDGNDIDNETLQTIDNHPISLLDGLQQIARHSQLWISAGGMHVRSSNDTKVYNTHLILNHQGELQCHYRKIHLFDVHIPVLLVPSAFTVPTGSAHWHILLRARAIEQQCYVIAAAQYGQHNTKRCSYGHSLVINPWGEVLVDAGGVDRPLTEPPSIVTCDIDLSQIQSVRERMPISVHRKKAKWI